VRRRFRNGERCGGSAFSRDAPDATSWVIFPVESHDRPRGCFAVVSAPRIRETKRQVSGHRRSGQWTRKPSVPRRLMMPLTQDVESVIKAHRFRLKGVGSI
jgi:hypothetical protein